MADQTRSAALSDDLDYLRAHYPWEAEAAQQLEAALDALRDPAQTSDAVLAAISLADLAYRIALGEKDQNDWPQDAEPECICPPELLARGGFKGGCPAHG